jgi:broad specificity phosphatase PhoE
MYLLRHGQSQFNLLFNKTGKDPGIEDPELTPHGVEQAAAAARQLGDVPLTRIIISPFTRALQTAQPMLARHDVQIEIMHLVRERAYFKCDVGSAPELLASRFPHHEFTHLPSRWWNEGIETAEETVERATAFRELMVARDDSETTLVVSHWAFILALTGISLENGELLEYDPRSGAPHIINWDA